MKAIAILVTLLLALTAAHGQTRGLTVGSSGQVNPPEVSLALTNAWLAFRGVGSLTAGSMTTTQRNALSPTNGMVIYNTTDAELQFYSGGAWIAPQDVLEFGAMPASLNLTNWSLLNTNVLTSLMPASSHLTNWSTLSTNNLTWLQFGDTNLTNFAATATVDSSGNISTPGAIATAEGDIDSRILAATGSVESLANALDAFASENQTIAAQWTMEDLKLPKVPIYAVTTNTGVAFEYDWTGAPIQLRIVEGNSTRTEVNAPTGTNAVWGPIEILIADESTNCTMSQIEGHVLFGRLTVGGIVPTEISPDTVIFYQALYTPFTTWFFWRGNQDASLLKVLGGSGNIYGVADFPEFKSPTMTVSAGTNIYPDFSQGPLPVPMNLSTNLNIATPSGMTVAGRAAEIFLPISNTNTSDSILLTWSSEWQPRGVTNTFQVVPFGVSIPLRLVAYGTTPYLFIPGVGGGGTFAGEESPDWTPGVLYNMESDHSFVISSATYAGLVNQQNTSSPHIGSQSLTIITTNVAHYQYRIPNQTARSEVWVAGTVGISSSPAGSGTILGLLNTSDGEHSSISISTGRALSVLSGNGTTSAAHATLVPTTGHVYWMLHYTKSTGTDNATSRLYVTADPSSGWGTAVESTDGTNAIDMRGLFYKSRTGFGSGRTIKHDHLVWSAEAIPASYFIGL